MVAFNRIPSTLRVSGVYSEVDNSQAVSGSQAIRYRRLMIGSKVSAGTAVANKLIGVTSKSQAATLFGAGSILHGMCLAAFAQDVFTPLFCMPVVDDASAVKAIGSVTFAGTPTVAGTVFLYVSGRLAAFGVLAGDAASVVAGKCVTAVNTLSTALGCPMTAAVDGSNAAKVNLTARNGGLTGNSLDLRVNYYADEELPNGMTATVVQPTGGATNPDLTTAVANMGEEWFQVMAMAYVDSANLVRLETELADRWGPYRENEGHLFTAVRGTLSAIGTLGLARNSEHHTQLQASVEMMATYEKAAESASVAALYAAIDPARPLQNLPYAWCLPAASDDLFTVAENNILLYDHIGTTKANAANQMIAQRFITTYATNAAGGEDPSYLDCETMFTLMYIRHDWREYILRKYPRHKLAGDGNKFGADQPIMTPSLMLSEMMTKAREWEQLGLIENVADFKNNAISERNMGDPNRLDNLLPPDLVNQLRIVGNKIQFRL